MWHLIGLLSGCQAQLFCYLWHILSSNKRQDIKKGSPEPILPISSSLQSNSDEEDLQPDNGSADTIHSTVETNHVDSSTENRDGDVQKSEVTRLKSKLTKKKESDGQDLNDLTVPEVAKALVMVSF